MKVPELVYGINQCLFFLKPVTTILLLFIQHHILLYKCTSLAVRQVKQQPPSCQKAYIVFSSNQSLNKYQFLNYENFIFHSFCHCGSAILWSAQITVKVNSNITPTRSIQHNILIPFHLVFILCYTNWLS